MRKTNKKGFTIVELVIVIAVIAILAAVLIPTFSGVIEKANKNADLQAARNSFTNYYASLKAEDMEKLDDAVLVYKGSNYSYLIENGAVVDDPLNNVETGTVVKFNKGTESAKVETAASKTEKVFAPAEVNGKKVDNLYILTETTAAK